MTDIIIIGAGTAGLSAAIYARRAGREAIILEALSYGGQIVNTPEVENYPGIKHISGFDFATGLYEQATELGAKIVFAKATGITVNPDGSKTVHTASEDYNCKAVIIATGAKNRPLGLDREEELTGNGVSYCATCDGAFYKKQPVAVNGGGNTAVEDAAFLANYCSKVYVIHRRDSFRADEAEVAKLKAKDNVEFVLNSTITRLIGEDELEGVEVTDKISGESKILEVSGLFVAIGQMPDNNSFSSVVKLDEKGYITAGEDCLTETEGIFTAGDCRTKSVRQLTTAAADGAVAALAASAYCG
ncbi:MAG: FAD-dependent oxidoreductase [Lachnospiraceae bacterium]|jgi:thioredoxin reductase (NADPH)|nr:FAD-dependent oxidoreductase [Lachnospiraceae bacterium]